MEHRLFLCLALIGAAPLAARQDPLADPFAGASELDRAGLVAAVLERNPGLEASRRALEAAQASAGQAAALEQPMASYAMAPASVGAGDVPFGQEIELSQPLPYPGRRRLRGDAAAAEAAVAAAELDGMRIELSRRASELFDDDYVLHRSVEINAEHAALLEDFKSVATARYAAGLASQQDPLEAEAELAHLLHDGVLLRSQLAIVEAEINALLHRPPAAVLPSPPPELSVPPFDDAGVEAEALEAQAFAQRPELRRAEAATRARQAELELAKLSGRPDFAVSASYNSMWTDPEHRWMVGASMTLPVWRGRVEAAVAMAEASLAQAKTEYDARQDEVRRDVALALVRSREAHHVLELFRSRLLPVAKDRVQAALAGFRSGKNDFLALIEAERGLRSVKLEYHQALSDVYRRRAELDAALGSPVSFAEDRNQGGGR